MRVFLAIILFLTASSVRAEILALYLSWYDDPTTTMTIHWHTPRNESMDTISLERANGAWETLSGSHHPLGARLIHHLALSNLTPDTDYAFRIGKDPALYKFHTAPRDLTQHPIRFVVGGDVYRSKKMFRKMSRAIIDESPLFAVIGGDIAYALPSYFFNLFSSPEKRWCAFLRDWKEWMISPEGHLIPFLLVPGNHDITHADYELFFSLFAFPEKKLYRSIQFGNYLELFLLDTDHFSPIENEQTQWLSQTLANSTNFSYCFPIYHVAAYPSYYPYSQEVSEKVRTYWCPLFDQYQLPVAFEHHNHTFKRTHPIRNEKVADAGVIYLGDGCWGSPPRSPHKDLWYIEKAEQTENVYILEISGALATIKAINQFGKTIDQLQVSPRLPPSSTKK